MARLSPHATAVLSVAAVFLSPAVVFAQTTTTSSAATACPTVLAPSYSAPIVGAGWVAQLIARNLTGPRSILFDGEGALLVVQKGVGISRLRLDDKGGTCLVVNSTDTVVENADVSVGYPVHAMSRRIQADRSAPGVRSSTMLFSYPQMETRCMHPPRTRCTAGLIIRRMDPLGSGRRSSPT